MFDEEHKKIEVPGYERLLAPVAEEHPSARRQDEFTEPIAEHRGHDTVYTFHYMRAQMTTTLSVRIDSVTKKQLEALAKRARRSKSFLAAEAIAAYVEAERWQLDEIQAGLDELDAGRVVAHGEVSKWLRSWGKKPERKAPRA